MVHSDVAVKENVYSAHAVSCRTLVLCVCACAGALVLVSGVERALPPPAAHRATHAHMFAGHTAHAHLRHIADIGPRVAGSYENEVLCVSVLVSAIRAIEEALGPRAHNTLELRVQRASGALTLSFMDGLTNVYRHVQSVVVRVAGRPRAHAHSPALLLNCHYDSVPDSPGASDDAAGCAVLLEVLRAVAASPAPLARDVIFLFNGAEENIMQASHAFITQHPWAKSVRAFINVEACGAGGREVLFQAGPHDPWILEVYAGVVPHPFASSLAQELFESGLIPADTDFRVFRDYGNLSGLDLAWSANGYVYHTRLDTVSGVSPAVLQRTGDNVLALVHGLLASEHMSGAVERSSTQPVYFDVLGLAVVAARPLAALSLALLTLALVALKIYRTALHARAQLLVSVRVWVRVVWRAACAVVAVCACGACASCAVAVSLHAAGARLSWYARPVLLAPLYAAPALAAAWSLAAALARRPRAPPLRGWWAARAVHDALALVAGATLALCAACGLRSGFLPLLWALLPSLSDLAASLAPGPRALWWSLGAALPLLQTLYLQLNSLYMFVPMMGRAGSGPLPPDVVMSALTSCVSLAALSWLLPLVVVARGVPRVAGALCACCALAVLLVLGAGPHAAYSPTRPHRLMMFHTRRTVHAHAHAHAHHDKVDTFYWVPELDPNTLRTLETYVAGREGVQGVEDVVRAGRCAQLLYCGAPYYLPVLSLVARSYSLSTQHAPHTRLHAHVTARYTHAHTRLVHVLVTRTAQHTVLVVAPPPGAALLRVDELHEPAEGPRWGARRTYLVSLHSARGPAAWNLSLWVSGPPGPTHLSLASHQMFGEGRLHAHHLRLAGDLPDHVAHTGWGVDLHLYTV